MISSMPKQNPYKNPQIGRGYPSSDSSQNEERQMTIVDEERNRSKVDKTLLLELILGFFPAAIIYLIYCYVPERAKPIVLKIGIGLGIILGLFIAFCIFCSIFQIRF